VGRHSISDGEDKVGVEIVGERGIVEVEEGVVLAEIGVEATGEVIVAVTSRGDGCEEKGEGGAEDNSVAEVGAEERLGDIGKGADIVDV
jgi:hypothetical protein